MAGGFGFAAISTHAATITYVDAAGGASGNTVNSSSGSATDWFSTDNSGNTWEQRGFANGVTVFESREAADPEIKTQITGLSDGTYDVWAFFWDNGTGWSIYSGFESGSLTKYETGDATAVSSLDFTTSVLASESNRTMYGVNLGQSTVSGGSAIEVFIDDLDGGGSGGPDRTWYDGVGYSAIPEASTALLLGLLGAISLIRRRR